MAGGGIGFLFLEFPPVLHVGVVDADLRAHLGELADQGLGAAVTGVAHVLAVGGPQDDDAGGGDDLPHVAEGVADQFGGVEGPGVVDVDGQRRDLEDVVVEAHEGLVGPDAEAAVLGEAVAADAGAGEDHVGMGGADLDRFDYFQDIHAVALGEETPFVEEGEDRGPVGVLDDLAGLALDGAVQDGEGVFLDVQDLGEEAGDPGAGGGVGAAADAPEIPDGGDVFPARHDALVGVGEERLGGDEGGGGGGGRCGGGGGDGRCGGGCRGHHQAALLEGLLDDGIGDVLRGAGGYGGLDEDEAVRGDALADDLQALLEGGDVGVALAAVAEGLLEVIALDVHDNHVGERQGVVGEGGGEGLFLQDTAGDEGRHLGVLGLHGGDPAVEEGDLPVGARRGPLHPDDEFVGKPGGQVFKISIFHRGGGRRGGGGGRGGRGGGGAGR